MAVEKTATRHHAITATLTDEERSLLEAFAAEQDITDLQDAIPALLHELVRLHDALWDTQFARSTASLDRLARKAIEEDRSGQTEEFDPNTP